MAEQIYPTWLNEYTQPGGMKDTLTGGMKDTPSGGDYPKAPKNKYSEWRGKIPQEQEKHIWQKEKDLLAN